MLKIKTSSYIFQIMSVKFDFKKMLPHIVCVAAIIIINVIYFYPQVKGKQLEQGDIISSKAMVAESDHYSKSTEKNYLWNNGQFSGMPRLLSVSAKNNLIVPLNTILRLGMDSPIGIFISIMLMFYILFVAIGINPYIGLFMSIGITLSADNLLLWKAGHNSKVATLAFTPLLILGIWLLFEKYKYLLGGAVFALGLALSIYTRHPQMTYYVFIIFGIYGIIKVIRTIRTGEWKKLITAICVVIFASAISLGSSASKVWSMYDYNKSSMRGKPVLQEEKLKNSEAKSSSAVNGLDWGYAMQWSNSTIDLIASYIPGFAGGGSSEKVSKDSETYKNYKITRAPLYWGELPFTEGPIYIGAVLIFLFVFGLFYIKGDMKIWLGISLLITVLMSMGKHFEFFNKFLFDYLPLYNKFRTPQSILSASKLFVPVLGAIALQKVLNKQKNASDSKNTNGSISKDFKSSLLFSFTICGGFALLMALLGPSLFSFDSARDAQLIQGGADITPIIEDRAALLRGDSFRTFMLILATASILWFFAKQSISKTFLIVGLGALLLFDSFSVGKRYLWHDDFVNKTKYKKNFTKRAVDEQILAVENKREGYRVFDLSINTFNSSATTNWHNTIGGYHPAKLQRYQDIIEKHISKNNMAVLNMLNTKYFIVNGQNNTPMAQQNPQALGNAWVVDEIIKVKTPNEEINALSGTFNPAQQAVVLDDEFNSYIGDFDPVVDPNATIRLDKYEPDFLTYTFSAQSEQMVVFSEIWYGPDKGWEVYLDGEKTNHIRVNYVLRGMRVPAGEHTIEFKFLPKTYYVGEQISLASSLALILFLLAGLGLPVYKKIKGG